MVELIAKISFVSCCQRQRREEQVAWKWIADGKPDLLLMLGDNVYADDGWDIDSLSQKYTNQWKVPNFKCAIDKLDYIATWDDHDLGPDNSKGDTVEGRKIGPNGKERRVEARELFLRHLSPKVKDRSKLISIEGEIFCSYSLNGVRVIVLDARFYRQEVDVGPDAQFLGEVQEEWLWDQLALARSENAIATIVCCGSTINSNDDSGEEVIQYERFYQKFRDHFKRCPNPVFLSGDIHKNKFKNHGTFIEAISSGVARRRERKAYKLPRNKNLNNVGNLYVHDNHIRVDFIGTDKASYVCDYPIGATKPRKD